MSYDAFQGRECRTCVMWEGFVRDQVDGSARCRRFPPAAPEKDWPRTKDTDVCGEHTAVGSGRIEQVRR